MNVKIIKAFLNKLFQGSINDPDFMKWYAVGLGLLNADIDDRGKIRVHIWDSSLKVPNVSTAHTHPWNFTSYIVDGTLTNYLYAESLSGNNRQRRREQVFTRNGIRTISEELVYLEPYGFTSYPAGSCYSQNHADIHSTGYTDGTVTIVEMGERIQDWAYEYFAAEGELKQGTLHRATPEEIRSVLGKILKRWA